MPGILDDVEDFLFPARKVLKQAGGSPDTPPGSECPNCGVGLSQEDIMKANQAYADKKLAGEKAAKAPAAKPAASPLPKKTSSIGTMMQEAGDA